MLIAALDDLWDKSDRYRRLGLLLPTGSAPRLQDHEEHLQLLGLVEAGDGPGARALMQAHIERSLTPDVIAALDAAGA